MRLNLGFSYIGLIFLAILLFPNIIYAVLKPNKYNMPQNKFLNIFEKVGQILIAICLIIFDNFSINYWSNRALLLILSFILILMYECFWIRYFLRGREEKYIFKRFLGIPIAGALLPVISFFILGIYAENIFLLGADIIFAPPHIKITILHKKEYDKKNLVKENLIKDNSKNS